MTNTPQSTGYALGGWWTYSQKNISNTSTILFRKGSSIVENPYSGKTISENAGNKVLYDLDKQIRLMS